MSDKVFLILYFCTEIIYVLVGMSVLFGGKIKRKWILVLGVVLFFGYIWIVPAYADGKTRSLYWLIGTALPHAMSMITVYSNKEKRIRWLLRRLIVLIYIDELLYMCINDIFYLVGMTVESNKFDLLVNVINIMLLLFIIWTRKKYHKYFNGHKFNKIIKKSVIPMLVFFASEIGVLIIWLDMSLQKGSNERNQHIIGMVLGLLAMISIGIFVIMVLYIKSSNEKMERLLIAEKQMKEYQSEHYNALLSKELETRKYRHDMTGHMVCINTYINEKDIDGLAQYMKKLNSYMEEISCMAYHTEIKTLDVLWNHYCSQLDESTEIEIIGEFGNDIIMSEAEQCTIFSNLIKNAVEAIGRVKDRSTLLYLKVTPGVDYVKICIKNSFDEKTLSLNVKGKLQTSKEDKENHGFGVSNIIRTIEKNGGTFEYYIQNHLFVCNVTLPARVKDVKKEVSA